MCRKIPSSLASYCRIKKIYSQFLLDWVLLYFISVGQSLPLSEQRRNIIIKAKTNAETDQKVDTVRLKKQNHFIYASSSKKRSFYDTFKMKMDLNDCFMPKSKYLFNLLIIFFSLDHISGN